MIEIHDFDEDGAVRLGVPNITRCNPWRPDAIVGQEQVVLVWVPRAIFCCPPPEYPAWPAKGVPGVFAGPAATLVVVARQCGGCGAPVTPYVEVGEGDELTVTSPWVQEAAEKVAAHEAELAADEEEDRLAAERTDRAGRE